MNFFQIMFKLMRFKNFILYINIYKKKNRYSNLKFAVMDANELEFPSDDFDHVAKYTLRDRIKKATS